MRVLFSIGVFASMHLAIVLATLLWLPSLANAVLVTSSLVVFVGMTWLIGVWNPSLSGWRRAVVILGGALMSTVAIALVTVAALFEILPMLGYRP